MTEAEREELVENMKTALVNARLMGADYEHAARAALAVAEPVIREQCAKICEGDFDAEMKGYGDYFATAIREGGKDE
jgi:hypothetical protein